jgi:hypothetical protein
MERDGKEAIANALQTFGLAGRPTGEQVAARRQELLATWNPHRYANLTNNPRKYMQMYTKAEAMTKDIESAFQVLSDWLKQPEQS